MTRNQQATAGELKIGDRFYKASDKKKTSLQIVDAENVKTLYRTYKLFCAQSLLMDNHLISERLKRNQYSPILSNTPIVFLRNVNDI